MYLNSIKFWFTCIVTGGIALGAASFGVLLFVLGLQDEIYHVRFEMRPFDAGFIILSVSFLMVAGIYARFFLDAIRAYRISRIFKKNEDGLLEIKETAEQLKMKQYKFFAAFQKLVGKRLLRNCSVFSEDPTYIILADEKHDIRAKFTVERCKNCAAPNTVRIGFKKECKYCGSKL